MTHSSENSGGGWQGDDKSNERLISLFKVPKNSYLSSGVAGFCAQAFCADWDDLRLLKKRGFNTANLVS